MKIKSLVLPLMAFCVLGFTSCSDDNGPGYSASALKNTELMTILKSKGYTFDQEGKLELNDLANNTTSLDLSGTKLTDFTGLDILPNLKEVKLANNGYGPSFDFAKLPAQITGIDLTGNDIHNYDNLVSVKVEENDDETVTNLHNITKLYLPAEAKFNIKDLVRFYRKNKADIESGKIDMQMADDKGTLRKYNTLRTITDDNIRKNFKKFFSSIFDADSIHIDINKRMSNTDKQNNCSLGSWNGVSSATTLEGIQYIVENPYWEGNALSIHLDGADKLPYMELSPKMMTMALYNLDASAGLGYTNAKSLTTVLLSKVTGLKLLDYSHSTLFGQRNIDIEQNGPDGTTIYVIGCPDIESILLPEKTGLRAYQVFVAGNAKLKQLDLSKFKMIQELRLGDMAENASLAYPNLTEYHTVTGLTEFACTQSIFDKQATKDFIKKYYVDANPPTLKPNRAVGKDITGVSGVRWWTLIAQ